MKKAMSTTFLNRCNHTRLGLNPWLLLHRKLHIEKSYEITDQNNRVASVILKTMSDMGNRTSEVEDGNNSDKICYQSYRERSISELVIQLAPHFSKNHFLLLKINQSVIDPRSYTENEDEPVDVIYVGHVLSGLFSITANNTLEPYQGSLISKIHTGMESDSAIMDSQLFFKISRSLNAAKKCSGEYFWIISLDKFNFTQEEYLERCRVLKLDPGKYILLKSACGQMVYRVLTGSSPPKSKISAQFATQIGVYESLSSNDDVFLGNLRNNLIKSGLAQKYIDNLERNEDPLSSTRLQP